MSDENLRIASQVPGPGEPVPPPMPGPMPPPPSGGPGNIAGLVFNDTNGNGVLDGDETLVPDATVSLIDVNTGAQVGTVTDQTGSYSFTGVFPSTYTVETGMPQTNASPTIVISPDPAEPFNNVIVNLGSGMSQDVPDMGSMMPENVGNVTGVKYFDIDGNGQLDPGEPGLANFTIYADINGNGVLDIEDRFTVTGDGGQYSLANLPATRLQILEYQLPGVSQTNNPSPVVNIMPGETIENVNFGNTPQVPVFGQIDGLVFNDLNGNNQADPGEPPVPGAALYIDSNGNFIQEPGERTTVTDNTGRYSFPGLFIGSFIVREVPPIGFAKNVPDPVVTLTVESPVNDAVNFANVAVPVPPPPPAPIAPPPPAPVAPPPTGVPGPTGPEPTPTPPPEMNGEPEPAPEPSPEPSPEPEPAPEEEDVLTSDESVVGEAQTEPEVAGEGEDELSSDESIVGEAQTEEELNANRTASQAAGGTGNIAGTLFQDFNANQVVDPNEPGAGGITVFIDTNNNNVLDEGEATSISDAEGKYAFGALPPGNYVVQVDGVMPTTPPPVITLVSGDDANFVNIGVPGMAPPPGPMPPGPMPPGPMPPEMPPVAIPDPLVIPPGVISGGKFNDLNGNGFLDPDEPARSGVTIYIDLDDNGELGDAEPSMMTDVNGLYRFDNVPAGIYRVREVLQPGEIRTSINPRVIVVPGEEVTYNFANTTIFGQPEFSSSISGVAFEDINGDGAFEPGVDPGVPGIQIYLDLNANGEQESEEPFTLTDERGEYIFRATPPGTYTVRQNLGNFEGQIQQVNPDPAVDSAQVVTVTVPEDNRSGINFINAFQSVGPNTISGIAFNDINGNQLFEPFAGETGIPGIEIYLDTSGDGLPQGFEPNLITGAGGAYQLDVSGVEAGSYKLRAFLRGGFFQTTSDAVIDTAPGASFTYNFGLAPEGIVSGKVFEDFNGNGLLDPGEPIGIPDVQIYVDTNNNGVFEPTEPNTFSNINGDYAIVGLKTPGTYTIREIPRGDLIKTTPDATLEVGLNQNITFNIGNSRIEGGAPPAGGELTSIGGTVFEDRNSNQLVDPDEPGLPGFTVYLDLNENGTLDEGEASTVTNAEGRYDFVNLPVRRDDSDNLLAYVVREVPQPGFTQTTPDPVVTLVEGESANFVNIGNAPGAMPPPANGGVPDPLTNPGQMADQGGTTTDQNGTNVLTTDESVVGQAQTEPEVGGNAEDELSSDESIVGDNQTEGGELGASSLNSDGLGSAPDDLIDVFAATEF